MKIEEPKAEPRQEVQLAPEPAAETPHEVEARVEPVETKSAAAPEPAVKPAEPAAKQAEPATKSAEPAAKPAVAADSDAPVFKVQILSSSTKLKAGDARFKGLTSVDAYRDGGMYKYTVGASTDYNEIYRLRKQVAATFPEAFIVALKGGQRVDVNAAIREFKAKKQK